MKIPGAEQTIIISKQQFAEKASLCFAFMATEFGDKNPMEMVEICAKFCAVLTYYLYDYEEENNNDED